MDRQISQSLHDKLDKLASKDLRVGQIFSVLFQRMKEQGHDPFFVENDILEKFVDEFLEAGFFVKSS